MNKYESSKNQDEATKTEILKRTYLLAIFLILFNDRTDGGYGFNTSLTEGILLERQ